MDDPRRFLDSMSAGYQEAIILLTANHLGIPAALVDGPRSAAELAASLDCDERALDVLLCALTAAGILQHAGATRFQLAAAFTPYLDPDSDRSLHSILDHHYHLLARWTQLAEVVRSGRPAPAAAGSRDPRSLRAFICGMKDISRQSSLEVADAIGELGDCRRLLDLGGGPGTSAITFCRRWPELQAVVFDLAEVVPIAAEEIAAAGMVGRITTRAGDYHTDSLRDGDEPPFDAIYVSNIIHSLSPQETALLLTKSAGALAPGGLLIVKDFFLADSRTEPAFGARFAVNMLVGTDGGKSYTWRETEELLADIGLQNLRRFQVATSSGVITARKPG
jgi:predicted O-methyltransferase YrrM